MTFAERNKDLHVKYWTIDLGESVVLAHLIQAVGPTVRLLGSDHSVHVSRQYNDVLNEWMLFLREFNKTAQAYLTKECQ